MLRIASKDAAPRATQRYPATLWHLLMLGLITLAGACSTNEPRRHANFEDGQDPKCAREYARLDTDIWTEINNPATSDDSRQKLLEAQGRDIRREMHDPQYANCCNLAYEHHPADPSTDPTKPPLHEPFELFYAEFDDQGMPTDKVAGKLDFAQSQIYLIQTRLREMLKAETDAGGGIILVVFTHGWHGNASADNDYSTEFKAILQKVTEEEARDTARKQHAGEPTTPARVKERLTIGVEIAWRGDSFEHPAVPFVAGSKNALNIWNRKHAAETVAKGSVHELLAFLSEFYLSNSCNEGSMPQDALQGGCDRVHMLTLGHSFGALINYGTLIARIERGLNTGCDARAYAFGDLTVLLNPAFEGSRYAPVFESAMHHPDVFGHYPGGSEKDTACLAVQYGTPAGNASAGKTAAPGTPEDVQLPVLVTLQSSGDTATGTAFPIFKALSIFSNTNTPFDDEARNEREAAGWVKNFRTHHLALQDAPGRWCHKKPTDPPWYCPKNWSSTTATPTPTSSDQAQGEVLEWAATNPATFPDYFPIWSVMVDASIMRDHDDIWNPRIIGFIVKLFRDVYDQADNIHYQRASATITGNRQQNMPTR
jgi:hypothetical protein